MREIPIKMPRVNDVGFSKSEKRKKFQRNRDVVLKKSETNRERRIQQGMVEGVCLRCRQVVLWRFQYNRYKPLKRPKTCADCRNKSVTKAYHTLCGPCAGKRNACPNCCTHRDQWPTEAELEDPEEGADANANEDEEEEIVVDTAKGAEDAEEAEEEPEGGEAIGDEKEVAQDGEDITPLNEEEGRLGLDDWDARRFTGIASSKYSKSRKTGDECDVFVFGQK